MKPWIWIIGIVLLLLIALAVVGYVGFNFFKNKSIPKEIVPVEEATFHIDIRDYGFMPENLTIELGEKIVWKNLGKENHSVIFSKMNLSSGVILPEADYNIVFNYSGNFNLKIILSER